MSFILLFEKLKFTTEVIAGIAEPFGEGRGVLQGQRTVIES